MLNNLDHSLFVEKYRPDTLEGYIGNESIKTKVANFLEKEDIPHLLFYARAGTGKTTLGKIICKGLDAEVLTINASDENNVDTIRTKIKSFASTISFSKWKVVMLDEADYLTPNAQAALRNIMEKFAKNTRFILTCNYIEKIIEPIQSRCTIFEIYPPNKVEVAKRLVEICNLEKIKFDKADLADIINQGYPDIRKCISLLQQQTINGELKIDPHVKVELNYMTKILEILSNKKTPKEDFTAIRQIIADSKLRSFDEMYRYLYDNLEEFAPEGKQAAIILEIAKAMHDDPFSVDKEINIMAMFINILKNT